MLDFQNRELRLADKVIVALAHPRHNSGAHLGIGTVTDFTPQRVRVEVVLGGASCSKLFHPSKVVAL